MDDKQFEQQLNLLKKSYNRVPSKFNVNEVLQKIEAEAVKAKNTQSAQKGPTSHWQKGSIWAVSLASVFLIGIISASFLNDENVKREGASSVADVKDFEELKKSYQKEKATRREMLEMTEEEFDQIGFVNEADQLFAYLYDEKSNENGYTAQALEEQYDRVIKRLKLPSEMVEEAKENGKMNEQESMAFIEELNSKIDHLIIFYNSVMEEHREILNTAKMNGQLDASYLYAYRTDLPKELASMLNNGPTHGIGVRVSPDKNSYQAYFKFPDHWHELYEIIENPIVHLFALKQAAPFTYGGELIYNPQESAMYLNHIEQTLLSTNNRSSLYTVMKSTYEDLAYTLIFGTPNTEVITEGRVNEEFQIVWNRMRFSYGVSPIKFFIRPVFEAVTENNWVVDETYRALDFNDLKVAFSLAETGDLAAIMPKEVSGAKSLTINWPNSEVQQKVAAYVKTGEYDEINQLIGKNPIESIILFNYAQEMKFININNQLLSFMNYNTDQENYDSIMNSWLQNELLSEEVTSLRYQDEKTFEQFENFVGSVDLMKGDQVVRSIPIIRSVQGIWQIDTNLSYLRYQEPNVELNDDTLRNIQDLYGRFKESYDQNLLKEVGATMVAGIYLEASTQGDLETQYELLIKGENTSTPSKEEFLSLPTDDQIDWKKKFGSFESIQSDEIVENEEYNVIVWFNLKEELITDEEYRKGFQMRKTVDGWRVHFMPFQ
ncbi:MAG: hypothetical protein ACE3JQ_12905 [Paenisporosarcina sp.]